ncbi:MAG TPA: hypothetical protein VFE50_15960 [Cyclobacteriaceae bacterium]|nr:hypothetical protein [Cyclobacteriaceae bacterium]
MKKITAILATVFVGLITFTAAAQDDKAAIKAIIEKETLTFFNADRKGWEETWVHAPYVYWSYSDSTGTSFIEGWESLTKSFDEYFRTQVANRSIDVAHQSQKLTIDRTWKEVRVYGNGAFAHYIQRVKDGMIERDETSQVRILEKGKDGKWKIVCVGAIASYPVEEVVGMR